MVSDVYGGTVEFVVAAEAEVGVGGVGGRGVGE